MGLKYKNGVYRSKTRQEYNEARPVDRKCLVCGMVVGSYANGAKGMRSHLGKPANYSCVVALEKSEDPKHKNDKKYLPS